MIGRAVTTAVLLGAAFLVVTSLPDIARYLYPRIRGEVRVGGRVVAKREDG